MLEGWKDRREQRRWDKQRTERGFSDRDSWSFDYFLAGVISDGVRQLRERATGQPVGLTWEEWCRILMKIEDGFRSYISLHDFTSSTPDEEVELKKNYNEGAELFISWFDHLWD